MSPFAAVILVVIVSIILFSRRSRALLAFTAGILFLTQGVSIDLGGTNLFALRFIELAAAFRVVSRREYSLASTIKIDRTVFLLYAFIAIVFTLRSSEDFSYHIGRSIDAILCYIGFRGLVPDIASFLRFARQLIFILVPYTLIVMYENATRLNIFSLLDGLSYGGWEREGRLRCQGSFRHPSLLGGMAAAFMPLFIALWFSRTTRVVACIGVVCCATIVWASNSGGPASSAAAALGGWLLWPLRRKIRIVQYVGLFVFLAMAVAMKAPVWYLLARVSSITGGTGWHRSYLIDRAVHDIEKWWFIGMPLHETAGWFPYVIAGTGGADITNQFISFGITAGLGAVILFVIVLWRGFTAVGKRLSVSYASPFQDHDKAEQAILWGAGVTILVHISNWLGIAYFDQSYAIWLLHLAIVIAVTREPEPGPTLDTLDEDNSRSA